MPDEFASLRARLAALHDRIVGAKAMLDDHTKMLNELIDKHDAICARCESPNTQGPTTESTLSKATADTDALETALSRWLENVEKTFAHPTLRKSNISM
jgi:hypothetical protein